MGQKDNERFNGKQLWFPKQESANLSLKHLPRNVGFKVCPCSSKTPFKHKRFRYIRKGCRLLHTNHFMDRKSYILEEINFNIPSSVAFRLRFRGEVPEECLRYVEQ